MNLLQLSLRGGVLIFCILLLRLCLQRRLPRTTFWLLWIVAAIRLLLPFSIPVSLPVLSSPTLSALSPLHGPDTTVLVPVVNGNAPENIVPKGEGSIWFSLWLVGAVLFLTYFVVSYIRCLRIFRTSVQDETPEIQTWLASKRLYRAVTVRWCSQITSPLTYGILRPVILLPVTLDRQDSAALQFVLTHELVHIRRFDALTKLLFAAALTLHWFNPMAWLLFLLGNRDLELSCDAWVIHQMGQEYRAAYALTLLGLEDQRGCSCCNQFSGAFWEERIRSIMQYKRYSVLVMFLVLLGIVGITSAFAVQPVTASNIQIQGISGQEDNLKAGPASNAEKNAFEIAVQWAKTMKDRDEQARYSLLASDSKPVYYDDLADGIGVSSPWVTDYDIVLDGDKAVVTYYAETSEPDTYIYQEVLTLGSEDDKIVVCDYGVTVYYLREALYKEALEIQEQVLDGHLTWRLSPESVALRFVYDILGLDSAESVSVGDQEVIFRTETGEMISVELYQPLRVENGFLAVYGYSIGSSHTILDNVSIY